MRYNVFNWGSIIRQRNRAAGPRRFHRRAERVRPLPSAPVEVQIIGQDSLNILHARDISVAGLGIHVPHRFAGCDVASEVQLVITLPGQSSFLARGAVKHAAADGGHFGVEFTSIDAAGKSRIREYVSAINDAT